jgi:hypothetical protein
MTRKYLESTLNHINSKHTVGWSPEVRQPVRALVTMGAALLGLSLEHDLSMR